ncbi:MAG: recombinase family protein [Oscillospiraceae bacterium]
MNCAVYARQSVEKKNSLSIDGQIELCKKIAACPLAVYKDCGYSGKNTHRPDFQRLLNDIRAGRIEKLYVYRLDRFSRSVADFGRLWETLQANHVEFVSVNENFDTSTPMGRAMLHIIMVFAQLERETTAERVRDNYYRRAMLGSWPGGPAPYGFTLGRCRDETGRSAPMLTPDAEKAAVVRLIFEEYAKPAASLGSVARLLNDRGIHAPRRDTWDNVSLSRLLHSPVYVMADEDVRLHFQALGAKITSPSENFDGIHGVLLVGKRDKSRKLYTDARDQSVSVLNSVGFIPPELWLACQNKLSRNAQIGCRGSGKHSWLSGLLKCSRCGYSLKVLEDKYTRYLLCSGRYNLSKCSAAVHADLTELEQAAARQIQSLLDACPDAPVSEAPDNTYRLRLDEIDRRTDRLLDAFSESEDLSADYLHRALARLERQRQAIREEEKRVQCRPHLPEKLIFSKLSFEEKKLVAALFIRRIEVGDNLAEIFWNV